MKTKAILLLITLLVVLSLVFAACAAPTPSPTPAPAPAPSPAPAPPPAPAPAKVYELSYVLFQPATAALSLKNTEFAKEIEKRTNGQVKITVHQAGSLLTGPAMYEGVRGRIADMGNGFTLYSPGAFPFTKIAEMPTAAESGWSASYAIYDFQMKYQPKEFQDVHIITTVGTGEDFMGIGTGKTPIKTLEDWKGKSIRPSQADLVIAMGGTVKDLPMADCYDAIAKGVIDGTAGSLEMYMGWKLGDVTKYLTINGAPIQPSTMWYNFMNKDKWNSLPPDIQKTITDVGKEYSGKIGVVWDDQAVAAIQFCKSVGDSIYVLPKSEETRWANALAPVMEARLKDVASKGFAQQDVDDAWNYFKSRVEYWNGQQAQNNVIPLMVRLGKVLQ